MTKNNSSIPEDDFSTLFVEESEQVELLNELNKNKDIIEKDAGKYLDLDLEKHILATYYAAINFEELKSNELFKALQSLLENTHKPVKYNPTQYLYNWVDLQEDGKLKSIYSGKIRNPEDVIAEDFEILTKRKNELDLLLANHSLTENELKTQKKRIEENNKLNCEHVVPQSWFHKQEPMRGDLHHLFACEPSCNSLRSNYPYHDFSDYEGGKVLNIIRQECGKLEESLFEPEYAKGIVARATLYFLLRYPDEIANDKEKNIDIELLLKWHEEFPVSIYERHRNQSIQDTQGNRNPLVDFPNYARKIDFPLSSS
ncbi:endonuclease I [Bacillus thuringiensis]|uniref:Endonuclease I n=1 Tax=Bacillus thuringiensis TaxID=1428 RepID=A0A9X6YF09_BACTU|nr:MULTISPECIES: endonuclease [Bacillus cereus group]OUB23470.1 endonuclease I [Bacillus thuringiensis serovar pirenaica]PED12313.1 endonuclease I [Bacillus thuringiensis]PEF13065.1 endonuclease I [Bacillus thuringiensis]PGH77491.1 endonuclease I [Bacillus thuringiensis]PGL95465.1 endonuclease I [Bacillus thuringiensis]